MAQGYIQRAYSAADGGSERPFDSYEILFEGVERFRRQPAARFIECLFAREDFQPLDFARAFIGLLDGRVEYAHGGSPNIGAYAVAFDEGNDRV